MYTYKIVQHLPSYVSGFDREVSYFDTIDELLNISWVLKAKEVEYFHRYSISKEHYLMAEFNDGFIWWVIGEISVEKIELPLPLFTPKYY